MNRKNKHIKSSLQRAIRSLVKISIILACILWFIQFGSVKAQVINVTGGAAISVTNGTAVQGDTLQNTAGTITNDGIIQLNGHYINIGTTSGNGIYNLRGNWNNTGVFNAGLSSVNFIGNSNQTITSTDGELFYNLTINNSGLSSATNRIILLNNVNISNSLSIARGNIETGADTLYLVNQASASLNYTSITGSRVIGKFERGVNTTANYLFPVGSDSNYNPMNLNFNAVQNAGSLVSEFVAIDPGDSGLPLPDKGYLNAADSVEVYDSDSVGYWSLTAKTFASNNYNISLDGTGFLTPYQNVTRIIKRPAGGDWLLDGNHNDAIGSVAFRNNLTGGISATGNHFGYGKIRPRIQTHPADTSVCDNESTAFSVVASGRRPLLYQWQEHNGVFWRDLIDVGIYSGTSTDTLRISTTNLGMDGYRYRVFVIDSIGNYIGSLSATLTVNPRPVAIATPQMDTICNGGTTFIDLNSDVPGTTFTLEVLYSGSILGTSTTLVDDTTIQQILTNPTLYADSVIYRIFPMGPFSTYCGGTADTVVIWVEPTVEINAVNDTICNGNLTNILVTSPNITTNGIRYTWTVVEDANISGASASTGNGQNISTAIIQGLSNSGLIAQKATYTITPWTVNASNNNECTDVGEVIIIDVWVEPTVEINAANDTICDGDATNIAVTSPNTTTNGIRYTWTVTNNPNITGETNSTGNGQNIGSSIVQNLTNTSFSKQMVQYTITPWTVNASSENECTDAGEVITVDIWIDPTPRVFTSIVRDTICNDTRTNITLTTPNVLTVGIVTFDYTSTVDAGLTGNSSGLTNLTDSYIIEDSLHNSTTGPAIPQVVRYTITPRALSIGCADGPVVIDSITVHPTADTYFNVDSVQCKDSTNGSAEVIAENGVNIFTYLWNDPFSQTTSTVSGVVEGLYTVTVTDNQSCIKIDSVPIYQPLRITPGIDTVGSVSCFGAGDGYIVLDPTGGNGTYSYEWSVNETTDSIYGLDGALYYVTVTDWKGCAQDTVVEVEEPPQTSLDVFPHHVRCYGENNGWAEVDAIGLSTYKWSTGETSAIISDLSPGLYTVTVTSLVGCVSIESTIINEPDSILIDSINSTNISCAGDADGILDLFVSGGNTEIAYIYNWFTPDGSGLVATAEDQTGLSGGVYYVTVTDWRGCVINDSAYVNEPPLYLSSISSTDVTCFEDGDGSIDLTVTGGNTETPYTYTWSSPDGSGYVSDEEDQNGLSGGNYFVTVTDAKNCKLYDTAVIFEPDLLEAILSETDNTCFGFEDGTINAEITGGNGGYIINWSNGATTDSIYGLESGTYYITVTDANNCSVTNFAEIIEPEAIENNLTSENITCFGYNNGEIVITPSGGTIPYTYLWSHSAVFTDSLATDLGPGNYSISVVDVNNCIEISNVDITQPDPLTLTVTKEDITCFGMGDGYISLSMFGGTPDYTYTWSNGLSETSATMLEEAIYDINITDLHDCGLDTSIFIDEPELLVINPEVRQPTCPDIQDGYINLNIAGGRLPYAIYWDDGSYEENLLDIRSGIYDVLINDSSYCEIDTSFIVRSAHDFCIDIPSAFSPNNDSYNDKWEIDLRGLYPNAEIEVFDRTGNRVFYSKGYEESQYWDGSYNGKELPMDAYYYIINLKNGAERISGIITLIR
ncbi:PKD-like domain-containing protein [Bacteroidota bacterium]